MQGRRIAAFVLTAAALAGCTSSTTAGDPTTGPTPTQVSSASSGPAPTSSPPTTAHPATSTPRTSPSVPTTGPNVRPGEKPPTLSKIGRTNTNAGEITFASYWMQSLDWAYATTSSVLARRLYSQSCRGCTRFLAKIIDYAKEHQHHFRGGRLGVISTQIIPNVEHNGSTAIVDVSINQQPLKVVSEPGRVIGHAKGIRNGTFRVWLRWADSRWRVVDWREEK